MLESRLSGIIDNTIMGQPMKNRTIQIFGKHILAKQMKQIFENENIKVVNFESIGDIVGSGEQDSPVLLYDTNNRQAIVNAAKLKIRGFKVYRYWIGGDVLRVNEMGSLKSAINSLFNNCLFSKMFSNSEWLTTELASRNIMALPLPFSTLCCAGHNPLPPAPPKPIRIIFYSIENNDHIYNPKIVQICAQKFPDVEFICVGNNKLELSGKNIINKGIIGLKEMKDVLHGSHCLLRYTSHDGFPRSVIEALGCGLHIITNLNIPFAYKVNNEFEIFSAIENLKNNYVQNIQGREWVFSHLSAEKFTNALLEEC